MACTEAATDQDAALRDGDPAMIHVSSLAALDAVAARLPAYDLLTLLSPRPDARDWATLRRGRHLELAFHDVVVPTPDLIAPSVETLQDIIDFGRGLSSPVLLVHCWAGISRSSAAAYVIACDRNPGHEHALAQELRRRAPEVTPNALMVALADRLLQRNGAMIAAVAAIGRGAEAFEGAPYTLPLRWPS